ncbi:MAG: hypothetical protein EOO27_43400, partial [Comamonadaceae bacterium]
RGEAVAGIGCVGAPIIEFGDTVAAISVCGPQQRLRVDVIKHRVMWTAAEISRRLMASACPPVHTITSAPMRINSVPISGHARSTVGPHTPPMPARTTSS